MSGPYKMKGSPMARNFGIESPLKQDKKKKLMTEQFKDHLTRAGLTKEEVQALEYKENKVAASDTTGNYANKVVARYEGLDYTQKEMDTANSIKNRKAKKAKKAKKTGE